MHRVLCVLFVVILGNTAVRFPKGYGTDNSAYLHHDEESELDNTQNFKSNVPAVSARKGSGLTENQKEDVINLCSTSDNGEDKTEDVTNRNKKTDSVSVTDDQETLDERYMKMTDDSNRNGFKNSDKQVNISSKTDNDLTISKTETTSTNSDTSPITIGLSGSSYITEKSRIDENSSKIATSASNIGKIENDRSKVKEPSYSSSFSIIEHSSDGMSSSDDFKIEMTSTDIDTKHLLTVDSSIDASFDKQDNIHTFLSNNGYENLVPTTISNIPLVSGSAVNEKMKSSTFNINNVDQSTGYNNFKTDAKSDEVTTGLPPFVSPSGIDVKSEFKSSSYNSESLSNSYSNSQIDRKSTNLDENIAVATSFSVIKSKDGEENSIDANSPTSSVSLIESSQTPYIGGSKLVTMEVTLSNESDSISHDVNTSDNKISDSSFEHFKSTPESINHQDNYSAFSSHTTGDSIAIVKPIPSNEGVNKNEYISGANHNIQTDKNNENSSIILVIVDENKHGIFKVDKGGHEVHHYIAGHRYSHESDSSDSSDESDESWEKDHKRYHKYNGHHYSHESDSSDDSSSNGRWVEGHNIRFYGHKYDNNDAAEDLRDIWAG